MKPYLQLFAIGGAAGTLLDGISTWQGIAFYSDPFLFKTAWWVPFLFGSATLLIGWSHARIHPLKERRAFRFNVGLIFLLTACGCAFLLNILSGIQAVLLAILYSLNWRITDKTIRGAGLASLTALAGCAVEVLLGKLGHYHYTRPDIFGIPYWLPFLYLHFSAAAGWLGRLLLIHPQKTSQTLHHPAI